MAFQFVSRWQLEVKRYLADYGNDCAATYAAAHSEDEADIVIKNPPGGYIVVGQSYVGGSWKEYRICRGLVTYDLSDLSPSVEIDLAVLTSMGAWVTKDDGIEAYVFDGTGLTGVKADYGAIGDLITVLGSVHIPDTGGYDPDYPLAIEFNSAGLAFLESKAGGIATLAFRVSTDVSAEQPGNCPNTSGYEEFYMRSKIYLHKLHINSAPFYIWFEGEYLAYLDGNYFKRLKLGIATGVTGKTWGQFGVKPNDTHFYYVGESGAERKIEGSKLGATGKIPGQYGLNPNYPSYFRYIDGYGDEESFMGDLAS